MPIARFRIGPILGVATALATLAVFLSAQGAGGTGGASGPECVQPQPAKRAIRGGLLFDFGLQGKGITQEAARAAIDESLRREADNMASAYEYACPKNCSATKIGSYETVPPSYALEAMPGGGYRAAKGSVVGFFVTLRCDPVR